MTIPRILHVLSLAVALSWAAVSTGSAESIRISGTGGAIGGMKRLGKAYERKHPGAVVDVLPSTGSTGGIKAARDGKLDICVSSRPLRDKEKAPGFVEEPYAKTAFVFTTPDTGVVWGLRLPEIEDIYAGRRTSWPDGTPIRLVLRPESDAFTVFLRGISPRFSDALESAYRRPGLYVGITDQDAADQIEKIHGAFGVTSYSLIVSEKRKLRTLAVDGILPPTSDRGGDRYPYYLTFNLVYRSAGYAGPVKDFIEFLFSKEGADLLRRNGHIPVARRQGTR